MNSPRFVHLHTHTHYSLLDGLTRIDELVARVKELGMDSIAITDHGVMYGAIEFYQKAKKAGIKPIIGCEIYVTENMHDKRPSGSGKNNGNYYHLVLLAENNTGYKNLIKLVTAGHLEGFYYKPRVDKNLLRQYSEGLIALSACLGGEVSRALLSNQYEKAKKTALEYQEIFGAGNFFLEVQQHLKTEDQNLVTPRVVQLAQETGIPLVATQDSHYLRSEDAHAHDVLLAVQTGNGVGDKDRLTMRNDDFSLLPPDKMVEKFAEIPEALENTTKIAKRCNVEIELGKSQLPPYPLPSGHDADSYLRELAYAGLVGRYGTKSAPEIIQRLDYELEVIKKTGFASYFLIVQDFVNWAKSKGIIVGPGRGSAAGSIVSYLLNVTNVDPLKYDLLFERFLNPERISMPDIDLDFDDARRDEVFDYVREKYGKDHFAQVITFGTMAARSGIRDAGRALGFSYDFCDRLAKLIPFNPNQNEKIGFLKKCLEDVDELKQLYNLNQDAKTVIDAAMRLEGVARHSSTHACAVVITPQPLIEYLPLQLDSNEGNIITQYEMHAVEDLGLLKMDFLGLSNLTIINEALRLVEQNYGQKIDIDQIPLDDKETFKLLRESKTTGIFQLECLTGDTIVSNTTLEKLYLSKNRGSLRSVYLDSGTLHNNEVIDVLRSGNKKVFQVIAEGGRTIKATPDHVFMTSNGWRKLGELRAGDLLMYKHRAKYTISSVCRACGKEKEISSANFKKHKGFCYKCSAKNFRNPSKPKSRAAISKAQRKFYASGGKPWNRLLTQDTNSTVALMAKKSSQKQIGITWDEKFGKKEAERLRKINSLKNSGANNPMFGKKAPHRKGGIRNDLGHYVRSNWEADFARILKLYNIEYQYEPQTFALINENGKLLSYTPDFFTPHNNTFYEIKGWMHDLDLEKINLFKQQHNGYNFVLINKTKFAELAMQYKNLIKWECPVVPNQLSYIKIKDIKYVGERETYDVAMKPPGNNFIANSFVVHNSSGMRRYLKELKPTVFEDIATMIALYRPGPMELIPEFVARKHGKKKIEYLHPKLEPVLANTYGIMIYQEQLMAAARALAGFTLAEADILRKAVGKKIKKLLQDQKEKLIQGCKNNGVSEVVADKFWQLIEPFDRYGFNKSHSISYAMIGYQTAYLKAHYPVEFMAALMNSASGDIERIAFLIEECQSMGVEVLPPEINESHEKFAVVANGHADATTNHQQLITNNSKKIRFGLTAVKNVGVNVVQAIIAERGKDGRFKGIEDFTSRVQDKDLNKKSLESLIRCGALEALGERATLLASIDQLLYYSRESRKAQTTGQVSLFGGSESTVSLPPLRLAMSEPATRAEKLMWEKELLGLFITDHPLKDYQQQLNFEKGLTQIKDITSSRNNGQIKIGGMVTKIQKILTKQGKPMVFSWIEDLTGKIETVVFPNVLEANPGAFVENKVLVISGKLNDRDGIPKLLCDTVRPIATLN